MTYTMTPIANGTRLRTDHNTFAPVITSYGTTALMSGDIMWEAPADGNEVKKGDRWMHVTHVNGQPVTQGWVAYIHKGVPICKLVNDAPPPPVETTFPKELIFYEPDKPDVLYKMRLVE